MKRATVLLAVLALTLVTAGPAVAAWLASGNGTAAASAGTLGTVASVTATQSGQTNPVQVSWPPTSPAPSGTTYSVVRIPTAGGTAAPASAADRDSLLRHGARGPVALPRHADAVLLDRHDQLGERRGRDRPAGSDGTDRVDDQATQINLTWSSASTSATEHRVERRQRGGSTTGSADADCGSATPRPHAQRLDDLNGRYRDREPTARPATHLAVSGRRSRQPADVERTAAITDTSPAAPGCGELTSGARRREQLRYVLRLVHDQLRRVRREPQSGGARRTPSRSR